jgi:ribosomal protein L37AE/L43A
VLALSHRPAGDVGVEQELHACPACPENRTLQRVAEGLTFCNSR